MTKIKKIPQKGTRPNYFEVKSQGWNAILEREEIQINCGENGMLMIVKTDEGFVVDAFDVDGDNINTMAVWEDDINSDPFGDDEDEPFNPANLTMTELEDFKDEWGQYTDEVCAELGYEEGTSDDLLMLDYFWDAPSNKWFPKSSSLYSVEEQAIADYIRNSQ
jgi:hypothetical protein